MANTVGKILLVYPEFFFNLILNKNKTYIGFNSCDEWFYYYGIMDYKSNA